MRIILIGYEHNERYYALPRGPERQHYLTANPDFRRYLDENKAYKQEHPVIYDVQDEIYSDEGAWLEDSLNAITPGMHNQLHNMAMGKSIGEHSEQALMQLYNRYGRESGLSYKDWGFAGSQRPQFLI
jgi:hypothetical protein